MLLVNRVQKGGVAPGIKAALTSAQLQTIIDAHTGASLYLDLGGATVSVSAQINIPSTKKRVVIRNGIFQRSGAYTGLLLQIGSNQVGVTNSWLNSLATSTSRAINQGDESYSAELAAGSYIIYDARGVTHTAGSPTYNIAGQLFRVLSSGGGASVIDRPFLFSADTPTVVAVNAFDYVEVSNCTFDGYNGANNSASVGLWVSIAHDSLVANCTFRGFLNSAMRFELSCPRFDAVTMSAAANGSEKYGIELRRCSYPRIHNITSSGSLRWAVTGQGSKGIWGFRAYVPNGLDLADHGCGGSSTWDTVVCTGSGATCNVGNPAFLGPGPAHPKTQVQVTNLYLRSTGSEAFLSVYPNSSVIIGPGCDINQVKLVSCAAGSSGLSGTQSNWEVDIQQGAVVSRANTGGGQTIQHVNQAGTVNAAGGTLTLLSISASAMVKGVTFGAPIDLRGVAGGTVTVTSSGKVEVSYNNASVPGIRVNSGAWTFNLGGGVFATTQTSISSFDAVWLDTGTSSATINGVTSAPKAIMRRSNGSGGTVDADITSSEINNGAGLSGGNFQLP